MNFLDVREKMKEGNLKDSSRMSERHVTEEL